MKKYLKPTLSLFLVVSLATSAFAEKIKSIDLYIPPVGVGLLMVDAAKDPALKKYADKINVVRWNTPDQLRGGIIDGSIDITFVPSYVGANFYNKGVKFKLANIITGGILYIMSTDKSIHKIEDLKGKTVVVPFQNDMPDLILLAMLKKLKLNGVKIKYVPTPMVGVKMAITGQAETILLPEVASTKVQIIAKKKKGITFHRSIDLQKEYGRIFKTTRYIPQAGVAVRQTFSDKHPEFISALHKALKNSAEKLLADPNRVIKMTNTVWKGQGEIFAKSIRYWNVDVRSAKKVKPEIVKFYKIMYNLKPAIIGGKLPDGAFYMQP